MNIKLFLEVPEWRIMVRTIQRERRITHPNGREQAGVVTENHGHRML
jgi:hypothetical protein